MKYANNILETIGNTPLIKLNTITSEVDALVLAKVESFNPGNSVKDRMAVKMIEDAESDGRLKPGGTIVEGTSGNTGMGLALAAIVKGYKLICISTDKQSKEKFDLLRAVGSDVIVCPTNVPAEDPRSYYSTAARIAKETPNSWHVNQYDNPSNTQAHYEGTGPEIWEQTNGKITHFVVGVGTGGTIAGLIKGSHSKQKVIGYSSLNNQELKNEVSKLVKGYDWDLNEDYTFGGYAKSSSELISFINNFKKKYSIQLDPIYSGKMLFGIFDKIKKGKWIWGNKILAIHTGGFQSIEGFNIRQLKKGLLCIKL